MRPIRPRQLSAGSRIGVFLPSEPIGPDRLERLTNNAASLRAATGMSVVMPPRSLLLSDGLFRDPQLRAAEMHTLLEEPTIDALIAGWGGKGCNEVLPYVDFELVATTRKPILGFSDIGVLTNAVLADSGLIGFYGPNVLGKLDESTDPRWDLLLDNGAWNDRPLLVADELGGCGEAYFAGMLVGGNLSTFVIGLSGTRWLRQLATAQRERIFFFEGSEPVQVQRQLLAALVNQGFFEGVTGVLIGHSSRSDEHWKVDQRIALAGVLPSGMPTAVVDSFGHARLPNTILPVGAAVEVVIQNAVCTVRATSAIVE